MSRPISLFTGQWADLPLESVAKKAKEFGYDGLELGCWGGHFDPQRALKEDDYCANLWRLLESHDLGCYALSAHLVGQAVCDRIDERHEAILPAHVWGDGDPEGVRGRASVEMQDTARAARRFFDAAPVQVRKQLERSGRTVVNGFTGSSIWHLVYSFPPVTLGQLEAGYEDFGTRWNSILDVFEENDVCFALEVHPTEIAFDLETARRALDAIGKHSRFGFNFDPSHFGYQGVDYLGFIEEFSKHIFNVHIKDVWWSDRGERIGVFGGHGAFGVPGRFWDFRSPGRGKIDFEGVIRALNHAGYVGPLTVEWEDPMMDREHGAREAAAFTRKLDFEQSGRAFDASFAE